MRAFDEGVTIKSKKGLWLAIPTPAAPRRGIGGKRISPSTFPEHRFGQLRFVYRGSGKPSLLVVDGLRARGGKRGGFSKAGKRAQATGRGLTTVVMFIMVPQVWDPETQALFAAVMSFWFGSRTFQKMRGHGNSGR
jgi:hypothetical protein